MLPVSDDPGFISPEPGNRDFYDLYSSTMTNRSLYKNTADPQDTYLAKKRPRLIIYPKDVQMIYGKSPRYARNLLQLIRESLGKTRGMPVTFHEFCQYTGIDEATVHNFIMES